VKAGVSGDTEVKG